MSGKRSKPRNAAGALFEVLQNWGVCYVFTCPGSTEAAFLDASLSYPDIEVVLTTHESIAVSMADGLSRAESCPSVVYLHANVGVANGIAHLYAAHIAGSPVVVINGLKPTSILNRGGFTTAHNMRDFVRQYVKWDWQVLRSDAIAEDLNRAFKVSVTEPSGPTWVGLAQDLLESQGDFPVPDAQRYKVNGKVRPAPIAVRDAARKLTAARRPLLVAGGGVTIAKASSRLVAISERLGAPVVAEDRWSLESLPFPTDHPHYVGTYRSESGVVRQADVIAFVGARCFVEFEPVSRPAVPTNAHVIHIHTNPSEIAKIYGVDSPLVGDPQLVLDDLASSLDPPGDYEEGTRSQYLAMAQSEHEERRATASRSMTTDGDIQVPALMESLVALTDEQTTIIDDSTTSRAALLDALSSAGPRRFYASSSGSLGWAMGAALGVKLGEPSQHVVAVLGDGVFQFGLPALWTAEHYRIAVTYVVVNNQAYAAVGAALQRYTGHGLSPSQLPLVDLSGPNIAAISDGFGVTGIRVESLSEFKAAFETAHEQQRPTVIEVMTDPTVLGPPYEASSREARGTNPDHS